MPLFRRGERRDGSRFSYPISGRGGEGYPGRDLEVFRVSSAESKGNEEFLINQALGAPAGVSYCPLKGRLLPKVFTSGDGIRLRLRFPGRYVDLSEAKEDKAIRIVGRKQDGGRETQAWVFPRESLARDSGTRKQFLDALNQRISSPLIRVEE